MRPLSAHDLMAAWDGPETETPHARLERLLSMVVNDDDLGRDSLGRRNQRLIGLRRALCGPQPIEVIARCGCGTENEITLPSEAIETAPVPAPHQRTTVAIGGRTVTARLPTMADLNAIASLGDSAEAKAALLARCLDSANDDDPIDPDRLLAVLAERFEAMDPVADLRMSVRCVGCDAPLSVVVDLASFVSRDIGRQVVTLMGEVDCLARAYGWAEADILALPLPRRRRYVAMVRGEPLGGVA